MRREDRLVLIDRPASAPGLSDQRDGVGPHPSSLQNPPPKGHALLL